MKKRVIKIIGDINEAALLAFCESMDELEEASKTTPIQIELSSGGGSAYDALGFVSRMRLSPCVTQVTAFGYVASAAVIILATGSTRRIAEEAWVMVHEDSSKLNGSVTSLERESKHLRRMEDQWNALLAEFTGKDASVWAKLHKDTTYLNAQQCLDLGLVDKII